MNVFRPANVLLPKQTEMPYWAVIACDQFTSDAAYWNRVRQFVGDKLSTLHMILPEAELSGNRQAAAQQIHRKMTQYLENGVFQEYQNAYVYVERTLQDGSVRPGLIGMVDLEYYDYNPGSVSLVRATEKTVLERIPPRREIRQNAPLEFPHVLMLCDDAEFCLIEPVRECKETLTKLYDFELMEDGGHITGWLLDEQTANGFDARFAAYSERLGEKYGDLTGAKVLLAVGDGNHSLAAAKSCYEQWKTQNPNEDTESCPLRYALVELENIHDDSQKFEPIHRIVTNVDCNALLEALEAACTPDGFPVRYTTAEKSGVLTLSHAYGELAVAALQTLLDAYLESHAGSIDYIHGDKEVTALSQQENAIGFLLPVMEKQQLFRGVIARGVLPRKTFSMGHAREKRYYLEGRKIR